MADGEENAELEAAPKPKKNMLVLILVAVNMLGMAGVAVYVLFFQGSAPPPAAAQEKEQAEGEASAGEFGPLVELNPIVANLSDADATRYVKVILHMEVADEEKQAKLEAMIIPIRDRMVLHLSGISADETVGEEQKERIKEQLKELANEVAGGQLVRNVYFGEFVVQ